VFIAQVAHVDLDDLLKKVISQKRVSGQFLKKLSQLEIYGKETTTKYNAFDMSDLQYGFQNKGWNESIIYIFFRILKPLSRFNIILQ